MKTKYKLNVDYLKLCYRQPEGLYETLVSMEDGYYMGNGYSLKVIERDENHVLMKVIVPDAAGAWSLGTLILNDGAAFKGKAFFEFNNRALYEVCTRDGKRPVNCIGLMDYIADDLGLELNNCTKVDIALDTNVNVLAKMKKLIRNHQKLDMYLCRHKVQDADTKLEGYGEYYASTRKRLIRHPEIIISQAKDEGTRLKVYEKTRELTESRPDKKERYFNWLGKEWNAEKDRIFRVEVSLRNEDIKTIHQKYADTFTDYRRNFSFLEEMQEEKWLQYYFIEGLESLLYFRDKTTQEEVAAF
ncbi:MAG: hypothetical protein J5965_14360 [Aeriscardovia sp.]|nr:hypothetical protein [Aeriscardovia sp.]